MPHLHLGVRVLEDLLGHALGAAPPCVEYDERSRRAAIKQRQCFSIGNEQSRQEGQEPVLASWRGSIAACGLKPMNQMFQSSAVGSAVVRCAEARAASEEPTSADGRDVPHGACPNNSTPESGVLYLYTHM